MTNYVHIKFLGDWCDVDVEYEVIDGDDSVGLEENYVIISCTAQDEDGNEIEFWDDLDSKERKEVIDAIKEDLERSEYENVND